MNVIGWFQVVVGVGIASLWVMLVITGQVPEIDEGRLDIWFHVVGELVTAALLIAGGVGLLRRTPRHRLVSALALGALGYSAINSPGYYAERGEWGVVAMFGVMIVVTAAAFAALWRSVPAIPAGRPEQRQGRTRRP